MKAMILAAGLGTRLRPLTETIPKALIEINGRTLLERAIQNLSESGFSDIIINVHHFHEKIIDYLSLHGNFGINIEISDESDKLLDTGGGIKKAAGFLQGNDPFIVYNVDVLTDIDLNDMYSVHKNSGSLATLAVMNRSSGRYLLFKPDMELCGWTNVVTNETRWSKGNVTDSIQYAFSGIQAINPAIFPLINETGKFSVIDMYLRLSAQHSVKAYVHDYSSFIDLGKPENLITAAELGY